MEQAMGTVCSASTVATSVSLEGHQKVGGGEEMFGVGSVAKGSLFMSLARVVPLFHSEVSLACMDFRRSELGCFSMG